MKKKKRQIGFIRSQPDPDDITGHDDDTSQNDTDEVVIDILKSLFTPAQTIKDADELLTTTDILQSVSQNCDTSKSSIYACMKNAGFRFESINSTLYWLVCFS